MSFRSQINFLVILLFQSFAINDVLARQPGSIDATFGHGGIVARSIGSPSISKAVAIQSDGKIVQSGWFATRFGLIRYNPNGELDPSFGNNGVVSTNINNWAFINSMMIQDDGGIVAAGFSYDGKQIAAIARYKSNGALDASFGGGTITTASPLVAPSPSVFNLYVDDMAVQPDGKVIIVGQSYYCAVGDDFCDFGAVEDYLTAVRYNQDGSIDTSFGHEGFLVETELHFYGARIAVRNDGKIIITGGTSILQYSPDGSRDTTFGDGGIANAPNTASDVVIQPDGKILISFYAYAENRQAFGIARFDRDGTLDLTFGNDGEVVTAGGGVFGSVSNSLALQADGRIVVAGTGFDQNVDWRYVIRRYDPDGTLDNSYGTDGITRVQVGGQHNEGFAVAVDAAGRAVVAGCAFNDSGWGLIRLNGGDIFSPRRSPFDFDGDGKTDISIFRPSAGEWWYSRSSDNAVKAVQFGTSTDIITPGDFTGDGKADVAFFRP